jgi:CRISPR-associated protein Cmr4
VTEHRWKGGLLGLHALTALHPGSGAALGTVDLPVQRERHTHWPTIAGSALKGILRDGCREQIAGRADLDELERYDDQRDEQDRIERAPRPPGKLEKADGTLELDELFGPPAGKSAEFAGAVSVTDARLLAFPVRSLRGVFAWISCPAVLERLQRDAALVGQGPPETTFSFTGDFQAIPAAPDCPCLIGGDKFVLEEFELHKIDGDAGPLAAWIAERLLPAGPTYAPTRARFARHFLVVHDDDFSHFVSYATEVTARIGLDYETKTVKGGALFYQEFLPAETLFYSVVLINAARTRRGARPAGALAQALAGFLQRMPVLQVGGDETTGKGYCSVRFDTPEGQS